MRIDEGHYGEVSLDGVKWVGLFAWPGPIHEGDGEVFPIVDEQASQEQRDAILSIMSGEPSEPGATIFNVFAATIVTAHEPVFAPIQFDIDFDHWTGHFKVPGYVDATASPITNPVTGESHQARVSLPNGFEYLEAQYVSSRTSAEGRIPLEWDDGHGHLAMLHLTPNGPVA